MQNFLGLPWTADFDPFFSNLQRSFQWPIHRMNDPKTGLQLATQSSCIIYEEWEQWITALGFHERVRHAKVKRFSSVVLNGRRGNFAPSGHSVMSRDNFDCYSWGVLLVSSEWRPGMLLNIHNAQDIRITTKKYLAKMSMVPKPCSGVKLPKAFSALFPANPHPEF